MKLAIKQNSLLVFLFLVSTLTFLQSTLFSSAISIYHDRNLTYSDERNIRSFHGLKIDLLEREVNRQLPSTESISLAPDLKENDFLKQRIAEALYPRRISSSSRFSLDLNNRSLLIDKISKSPIASNPISIKEDPTLPQPSLARVFVSWAVLLVLILPLGICCLLPFVQPNFSYSLVAGALVIALFYTMGTMFQLSIPPLALPLLGFICLILQAKRLRSIFLGNDYFKRPKLTTIIILGYFILIGIGLTTLPISDWDARSIWFFRAKELLFEGKFLKADMLNPEYAWSHPDYPLLLSSWISYFNLFFSHTFSERIGSLAIWTLFSALGWILWKLANQAFGKKHGLFFVLILLFGASPSVAIANVDGLLLLVLLISYFCLRSELRELNLSSNLFLMVASLLKWEGLLFSLFLVYLFRGKWWRNWKRLLIFAPSVSYLLWTRSLQLPSDYQHTHYGEIFSMLIPRTIVFIQAIPYFMLHYSFLGFGILALPLTLAIQQKSRDKISPAMVFCLFSFFFMYIALLFNSFDLHWIIQTAMGRLLLHSSGFSFLAFFEQTQSMSNSNVS